MAIFAPTESLPSPATLAFISLVVETMIVVPIIWFVILFLSLVAY